MKKICVALFCILIFLSCAARQTLTALEPAAEFERAMSFFNNRKYDQALEAFERILFYHASSEYVDDAQYWLARTYLEKKDYDQAIVEFDYLVRNFPKSTQLEDAYFYRAKAYLASAPSYEKDLSDLKRAIRLFDEFVTRYPNSKYTDEVRKEILAARNLKARKELENGKLYQKLNEIGAALIYYKHIMNTYPETEAANEARYRSAQIHEKRGETEKALDLYKELLDEEKWNKAASRHIADLEDD